MSFIRTRRNSSKPQIIKLETDDEDASKSTGKPCIDFQPDDRWQIKEEDEGSQSAKKKPNSPDQHDNDLQQTNNKSKSPAIVNGESTTHLSDSDNSSSKNNSVSNDDNKTEDTSSSKEECNNDEIIDISSPSNSPIKRNCRVRKKRKVSACDSRANGKKARSSQPENSDDDIINCSSGEDEVKLVNNDDEVKPVTDNEVKHVNDVEMKSADEEKPINEDKVKSVSEDEVKPVNEDKPLDEDKVKPLDKDSDEPSKSVVDCSNKDVKTVEVNGSSSTESKADDSLAAPLLENEMTKTSSTNSAEGNVSNAGETSEKSRNMPELSSIDHSQSTSKKDDSAEEEIMVINDKKSPDGGESDNEIQIIESTSEEKVVRPRLDEKICGKIGTDQKLSAEEILLSSGYPYYNSIAEKVKGFKAGMYNPVRFPHTGTLLLSDSEVIIESPSLLVPLLIKESDEFPKVEGATVDPQNDPKQQKPMFRKNFFQSSVGQFLINLGASRVLEWYHRDMKRTVIKQARKGGHTKELEDAVQGHEKKLGEAKEANLAFNFRLRRCGYCDFKTESLIVMEAHYLTPHLSSRREYKCNFCPFLTRDVKEISFHFEAIHSKKAVLENQMLLHECLFCTFQSHLKSKVSVHMNRCRKNFIQSQNQSPPYDFEFPGVTTKPVSLADINGHRRMILGSVKAQAGTFENYVQSAFAKKKLSSVLNIPGMENFPDSPTLVKHLMGPHAKQPQSSGFQLPPGIVLTRPRVRAAQQMRQLGQALQPRGLPAIRPNAIPYPNNIPSGISITPVQKQDPAKLISGSATGMKNITLTPISSAGNQVVSKSGPPQPVALFTNVAGSDASRGRIAGMAPGTKLPLNIGGRAPRMVPPYQRLNTPPSQVVKNSSGNTFVMCEICDAYIKDLDELRSHMNWVHKVKIHPKMLVSRPPLNCQKCQWRFFTDQGLERHLLGAHGLVTTNMQEMANNNQDGGRCIICGAVFTYKLVSHMTQVHKVTLKPAHLSYKCTVCTATFTLYRLFESHVYNLHSGSSKRSSEETTPSEPPAKKIAVDSKEPVKESVSKKCKMCGIVTENLDDHIKAKHMKDCNVKMCKIDKCNKCLYSSDELLVIRMSDFGIEEEFSSDESDSDSSTASEKEDESENVKSASDSIKKKEDQKAEKTQ